MGWLIDLLASGRGDIGGKALPLAAGDIPDMSLLDVDIVGIAFLSLFGAGDTLLVGKGDGTGAVTVILVGTLVVELLEGDDSWAVAVLSVIFVSAVPFSTSTAVLVLAGCYK